MGSPANPDPASRSRISSIGDAFSTPTGHSNMGVSLGPHGLGQRNGGGFGAEDDYIGTPVPHLATTRGLSMDVGGVGLNDKGKARAQAADGKSPVDKTFLLGFLNDFANKGR
jgi:mRNA-decapping enzyme subunit 2